MGNTASQGVRHLAGALEGRPPAAGLAGTAALAPVEGRSTGKAAMVGLVEMAAGWVAAEAAPAPAGGSTDKRSGGGLGGSCAATAAAASSRARSGAAVAGGIRCS